MPIDKPHVWISVALCFFLNALLGQSETVADTNLHEATLEIFKRLCETQVAENRGDTLFFESPRCGSGHPCQALLLDSLVTLESSENREVGVFRQFNVLNSPLVTQDSTKWKALTNLGTGRGYQVHFGLAYFNRIGNELELTGLHLNVGFLGEGFRLPEWHIHEFLDDQEGPWGAMVFINRSWRGGFGHTTLSVLDLGYVNGHEFTLNHTLKAQAIDGFWGKETTSEEWRGVKAVWDEKYLENTVPERHYSCTVEWHFEERHLIVEEHPIYRYCEKIDLRLPVDSLFKLPVKRHVFTQAVWPPRYLPLDWDAPPIR